MALALVGMPIDKLPRRGDRRILAGRRVGVRRRPASRSPAATRSTRSSRSTAWWRSGLVHPDKVKRNAARKAGDVLILGKPLGVGILSAALKKGKLSRGRLRRR